MEAGTAGSATEIDQGEAAGLVVAGELRGWVAGVVVDEREREWGGRLRVKGKKPVRVIISYRYPPPNRIKCRQNKRDASMVMHIA
jgi:hypothetical protein